MAEKAIKKVIETSPQIDIYSKEMVIELNKHVKVIRTEMNKVENSFSKIAFNLYWIYSNESYKALGYDDIYTLAKNEFNIARGTANNFINVVVRFGKRVDGQISDGISDEYKGYKSSQLIVMLGMEDAELKQVKEDMSVREIKKLKKVASSDESEKAKGCSSEKDIIDVESQEVNRTVMISFKDFDDYLKHRDTLETMIQRTFAVKEKSYKVEVACTW